MAYSYDAYAGDGMNDTFNLTFPYLLQSHVVVLVDGVSVTFSWITDSQVQTTVAPADGTVVQVRRYTSPGTILTDWADGSVLNEYDLDTDSLQVFYLAQEALDRAEETMSQDASLNWDALSNRIVNLADPVDLTDAVNLQTLISYGTASYPLTGLLFASGSVIDWNTGDVTLTHSANTLTWGGAANYVFQVPRGNNGFTITNTTDSQTMLIYPDGPTTFSWYYGAAAVTVDSSQNVSIPNGALSVDDVTDSTSALTGSIQTDGGLGVAKSAYVGSSLDVGSRITGGEYFLSTTHAAVAGPGATQFTGYANTTNGAVIQGYGTTYDVALVNRGGSVALGITAGSTSAVIGADLTVNGGDIVVYSGSTANYFLATGNGFYNWFISGDTGNDLKIGIAGTDTTPIGESKMTWINVAGGSGLTTFTGQIAVDDVTESTSTLTGSIQTDGGLGVAKSAFIGEQLSVGATLDYFKAVLAGTWNSSGASTEAGSLLINSTVTGANGDTTRLVQTRISGAIQTQGNTETITDVATVLITEPNITVGTGDTVTNASTLKINDAPTEGTNNYALWVDAGDTRLDGQLIVNGTATYGGTAAGFHYYGNDTSNASLLVYGSAHATYPDGVALATPVGMRILCQHNNNTVVYGEGTTTTILALNNSSHASTVYMALTESSGTVYLGSVLGAFKVQTSATDRVTIDANGRRGFGSGTYSFIGDIHGGSWAAGADPGAGNPSRGLSLQPSSTGYVGRDHYTAYISGTFTAAASGTHADVAQLYVDKPQSGGGVAATTNATSLKVNGTPASFGTNQYALWVTGTTGMTRLDGKVKVGYYADQGPTLKTRDGYSGFVGYDGIQVYGLTRSYLMLTAGTGNYPVIVMDSDTCTAGNELLQQNWTADFWQVTTNSGTDGSQTGPANAFVCEIKSGTSKLYLNDASNANMTVGLTINQSGNDNEIFALKSSSVAHGMTAQSETDTFFKITKAASTSGGVDLVGLKDADGDAYNAVIIDGYLGEAADATKTTGGFGIVHIRGAVTDGATSITAAAADANILSVSNNNTTRFILDADGDSHQDVGTAWTNFDFADDLQVMDAVAMTLNTQADPVRNMFVESLEESRSVLERLPGKPIITFNEDGHHFANMSRVTMLHHGAIRQVARELAAVKEENRQLKDVVSRFEALENRLNLLEKK